MRSVAAYTPFSAKIDPICFAVSELANFLTTFIATGTAFLKRGMNLLPSLDKKLPKPSPCFKGTLLQASCLLAGRKTL